MLRGPLSSYGVDHVSGLKLIMLASSLQAVVVCNATVQRVYTSFKKVDGM